ncbi:alpha/beta hydrolase [Verrucomicrobiaceae bacterium 5K15]|uniref:Alpha/beta hydrolase n=1 Tax=Oceaniferula flava TaxID=2800421 RepID=A0AAE2SDP4_9BACT|nr:alpha/beta fold hydrolase [Oceaniferula flavus]MBK1855859.1 alpha/beta hydrolase [Oceaniferula flavus]MBM1137166.1 alpha/beta hydrolase [Oceaniferula flavus]
MNHQPPVWTFLPGLHGSSELFAGVQAMVPSGVDSEWVELPSAGDQHYAQLSQWLDEHLASGRPRLLIAESFSAPIALRLAASRPEEICGIVLAAGFCDAPVNPGIALLPLRPLFMVKPPKAALRHYLIGDDAGEEQVSALRSVIKKLPSSTLADRVRTVLELQERDNPGIPEIPMMLLQAQSDNLVPWEAQQRLEACYPHAHVHWIESPHLILQRHPKQCMQHIRDFAESISQAPETTALT